MRTSNFFTFSESFFLESEALDQLPPLILASSPPRFVFGWFPYLKAGKRKKMRTSKKFTLSESVKILRT